MFQEGDLVEIPLPDDRAAIGRIIHICKGRFEGWLGFVVFGIKGVVRNDNFAANPMHQVLGVMYTLVESAEFSRWKTIERIPLTECDRLLTKRHVGGGVYLGDEYLGSVDELGEKNVVPMLFCGMIAVFHEIKRAFP
jgi:hypothetical protein